ncbi:hypothetical protein SAY87_013874 [Trapa incisa]|uniref:BHLH domain-containing protein n=1 Tax=Trapa incisa TaxID=236973 RepID=A0AAN7KI23_9MYRT|nr:hypothetical protein SAY87_013874 [Trapa incisa]
MPSKRPRWRQLPGGSRITDQIAHLVSKLQKLIPEIRNRHLYRGSASKFLHETCNYIRSLHQEVDDLSERLTQLLTSSSDTSHQELALEMTHIWNSVRLLSFSIPLLDCLPFCLFKFVPLGMQPAVCSGYAY